MEQIVIRKKNGTPLRLFQWDKVSGVTSAEQLWDYSGQDVVNISMVSSVPLNFDIGDTLDVFGRVYTMNVMPNQNKVNDRRFEYQIQMEGVQYDLIKVMFLDIDSIGYSTSSSFTMMGNAESFLKLIIANLLRVYSSLKWSLGEYPADSEFMNMDFQNETCLAVLQKVCDAYQTKFDIERTGISEFKLHLRNRDFILPDTFRYGRAKGLYALERMKSSDKNIITRLYAYGASKNLPLNYRGGAQRLKMPIGSIPNEGQPYIEDPVAIGKYGVIEGAVVYEDIFPNRTGTVTGITAGNVLQFFDTSMDFNLTEVIGGTSTYMIDGMQPKIVFKTGNLAGYEFTLNASTQNQGYVHASKRFTINPYTDNSGNVFPSSTEPAFQISVGDKYTIVDIAMPHSYISAAEFKLEETAGQYLYDNSKPHVQYGLTVDANFVRSKEQMPGEIVNYFSAGDFVKVVDLDLGIDGKAQIQALKRNLLRHYEYDLTLGDEISNQTARLYRSKRYFRLLSANTNMFATSQLAQIAQVANNAILNKAGSSVILSAGW